MLALYAPHVSSSKTSPKYLSLFRVMFCPGLFPFCSYCAVTLLFSSCLIVMCNMLRVPLFIVLSPPLSFQPFPDAWAFPVLTLLIVVIKWLLSVDHQPGQQVKRRGGTLEASSGTPRTSRHILALTPCSCRHAST